MNAFKASSYQITVQESEIEGTTYFVGAVAEIPDLEVFEDTPIAAYEAMRQVLEDLYEAAVEDGRPFPPPNKRVAEDAPTGRVTLRIPRTLHATLERQAKVEGVSLNQHMLFLLTDGTARIEQGSHLKPMRSERQEVEPKVSAAKRVVRSSGAMTVREVNLSGSHVDVVQQYRLGTDAGITGGFLILGGANVASKPVLQTEHA